MTLCTIISSHWERLYSSKKKIERLALLWQRNFSPFLCCIIHIPRLFSYNLALERITHVDAFLRNTQFSYGETSTTRQMNNEVTELRHRLIKLQPQSHSSFVASGTERPTDRRTSQTVIYSSLSDIHFQLSSSCSVRSTRCSTNGSGICTSQQPSDVPSCTRGRSTLRRTCQCRSPSMTSTRKRSRCIGDRRYPESRSCRRRRRSPETPPDRRVRSAGSGYWWPTDVLATVWILSPATGETRLLKRLWQQWNQYDASAAACNQAIVPGEWRSLRTWLETPAADISIRKRWNARAKTNIAPGENWQVQTFSWTESNVGDCSYRTVFSYGFSVLT